MYRIDRNNFFAKPKNSTVYTPKEVSKFIFEILDPFFYWKEYDYDHPQAFQKKSLILDAGSGLGSLIQPWKNAGYRTLEIDNDNNSSAKIKTDFLKIDKWGYKQPSLVLCNPPFNGYGRKLASEVWLEKIISLFGKNIPLVLFTPVGLRNNLTQKSQRYQKFLRGDYPTIKSIITLPKNIFVGVLFHSEILVFNIDGLPAHYFLPEFRERQLTNKTVTKKIQSESSFINKKDTNQIYLNNS